MSYESAATPTTQCYRRLERERERGIVEGSRNRPTDARAPAGRTSSRSNDGASDHVLSVVYIYIKTLSSTSRARRPLLPPRPMHTEHRLASLNPVCPLYSRCT